ncbi:MAG: hypothetical protein Q9178_005253 [Gyalolechia marmorata]
MSENYPFLAQARRRLEAETKAVERNARKLLRGPQNHADTNVPNEYARHIMLRDAQVVCINGPPGIERQTVVLELVVALGFYPVSVFTLVSDEIADGTSPYVAMLQTPVLGMKLPDRMYVEVLSKYLEKRIAQGERRFLVIDFPGNESQAAIFEEDASLIGAFVYLEGKRPEQTSEEAWEDSVAASRPVFEKLSGAGRAFKINVDQDPRELRANIADVVETLKSMSFVAKVLLAEDVFRPAPPPG